MRSVYDFNAPGYGVPTVATVASPTALYTAKPHDYAILLDVSGYGGAGPTIAWSPTPVEDFPVLVRGIRGSLAAHAAMILAPPGCTIEDPASLGTFAASISLTADFETALWIFDRTTRRLVLYTSPGTSGSVTPAECVTEIRFAIGTAPAQSSATSIANGAIIIDCELNITTPYTGGTTITVGYGASPAVLQGASDNNPQIAGRYEASADLVWVGPNPVLVTVSGAPAAGAGDCVVRYVDVPNP